MASPFPWRKRHPKKGYKVAPHFAEGDGRIKYLGSYNGPMADNVSKETRSRIMARVHGKDTKPEMAVRRMVRALGYRYRLHKKNLPGRPDLVFTGRKKVIFVHGCFWHVHKGCRFSHIPDSDYWRRKLSANQERDERALSRLQELGWDVLVLWECEIENATRTQRRLQTFLGASSGGGFKTCC